MGVVGGGGGGGGGSSSSSAASLALVHACLFGVGLSGHGAPPSIISSHFLSSQSRSGGSGVADNNGSGVKRVQAVSSSSRAANLNLSEVPPREVLAIRVRALEEAAEAAERKAKQMCRADATAAAEARDAAMALAEDAQALLERIDAHAQTLSKSAEARADAMRTAANAHRRAVALVEARQSVAACASAVRLVCAAESNDDAALAMEKLRALANDIPACLVDGPSTKLVSTANRRGPVPGSPLARALEASEPIGQLLATRAAMIVRRAEADVVDAVHAWLAKRRDAALAAGDAVMASCLGRENALDADGEMAAVRRARPWDEAASEAACLDDDLCKLLAAVHVARTMGLGDELGQYYREQRHLQLMAEVGRPPSEASKLRRFFAKLIGHAAVERQGNAAARRLGASDVLEVELATSLDIAASGAADVLAVFSRAAEANAAIAAEDDEMDVELAAVEAAHACDAGNGVLAAVREAPYAFGDEGVLNRLQTSLGSLAAAHQLLSLEAFQRRIAGACRAKEGRAHALSSALLGPVARHMEIAARHQTSPAGFDLDIASSLEEHLGEILDSHDAQASYEDEMLRLATDCAATRASFTSSTGADDIAGNWKVAVSAVLESVGSRARASLSDVVLARLKGLHAMATMSPDDTSELTRDARSYLSSLASKGIRDDQKWLQALISTCLEESHLKESIGEDAVAELSCIFE